MKYKWKISSPNIKYKKISQCINSQDVIKCFDDFLNLMSTMNETKRKYLGNISILLFVNIISYITDYIKNDNNIYEL